MALEFQSRAAGYSVWRMSQLLALMGKASRCKVRLFDPLVSRLHCTLVRTRGGLWVVDLLSRGGITINGLPVQRRTRPGQLPHPRTGDRVRARYDDPAASEKSPVPVVWLDTDPARDGAGGMAATVMAPPHRRCYRAP